MHARVIGGTEYARVQHDSCTSAYVPPRVHWMHAVYKYFTVTKLV